jgi:hypothetical protein
VEAALAGLADRLPLKGTGFCVENRRGAEEDTEIYYLTAETRRSQRLIIVLSYRRGAEFPEGARWRKERIIFQGGKTRKQNFYTLVEQK